MKIKKIHITKYGPISGLDLDIGPGLQIISGKNEAGKTLTIDAVIKMLLQGKTRDFEDVNRVDEDPEGFILFEDSSGTECKVNIKNGLAKHMDLGGLDLRNIFIIRDSDLSLRDECGYYKNITDKLTGLQLEKIDTVMALIKDHGRLKNPSSSAGLSDNKDYGKIASLLSQAKTFEAESREYLEFSGKENYGYLEFDQIKVRQEILDLKKKIKNTDEMLEWKRYKKLIADIKQLKKQWEMYFEFEEFNQKNYDKVSDLILSIGSFKEKLSGLGRKQEKDSFQRSELKEKLSGILVRSDLLEQKKRDIDRLESELEAYNLMKAKEVREPGRFPRIITIVLFILALLSFPAVYLLTANTGISFIMPGILLAAGLLIFFLNWKGAGARKFATEERVLENKFKKIGFKIKNLDEVLPEIAMFEDRYKAACRDRDSVKDQIRLMKMEDGRVSDEINNITGEKRSSELKLEEIFGNLGIKNIEGFREKRRNKNKIGAGIMAAIRTLQDMFPLQDGSYVFDGDIENIAGEMSTMIGRWEEGIEELRPEGDPPDDKDFDLDPKQLEGLREKLERLQEKENNLGGILEEHKNNLNNFQKGFIDLDLARYIDNYNRVSINSLERLEEAAGTADSFIRLINGQYETALEALKIFEDIKDREETKISDLFKRLGIAGLFKEITDGKYVEVRFDSQAQEVKVIDKYDGVLPAQNLSKGAYDQLFLAIRIAISEEILGSGSGFFIIDDAFLSSDRYRLKKQFEILKKLADRGWSIIYFSVKDEIAQLSREFTENEIIEI